MRNSRARKTNHFSALSESSQKEDGDEVGGSCKQKKEIGKKWAVTIGLNTLL